MASDIVTRMIMIFTTMIALLLALISIQTKTKQQKQQPPPSYLPNPQTQPSKYSHETYILSYTPIWITSFAIIIYFHLYESFTAHTYITVCIVLSLPLLLQPLVLPSALSDSPDSRRTLWSRYAFKVNVWLGIYSFVGNYWYTHYFYSVLRASYTFPSHIRLNNVPIALYFATFFYFSTYHVLSNLCLRRLETLYEKSHARTLLFWVTVVVLSYTTAFMETLTISSFPYYGFEDVDMMYSVGSGFYGIYFLVSYPAFYYFDDKIDDGEGGDGMSLWQTVVSSCGYCMMILLLLDFVRLGLGVPLVVGDE